MFNTNIVAVAGLISLYFTPTDLYITNISYVSTFLLSNRLKVALRHEI